MSAPRTCLDYLDDIILAMEDIVAFTYGLDEATFTADRKTVYAVTRAAAGRECIRTTATLSVTVITACSNCHAVYYLKL